MDTDRHGLRDLIIRHGWTRMDTVFALENSVYSVAIRAKMKDERWRMNLK